jgi:hypothetical protein
MAIGVLTGYPGVTQEQYERLSDAMGLGKMPTGELIHSCGPTNDGWRIIEVWESEDACERFVTEMIVPAAQSVAFPVPARREVFVPQHAFAADRSSGLSP